MSTELYPPALSNRNTFEWIHTLLRFFGALQVRASIYKLSLFPSIPIYSVVGVIVLASNFSSRENVLLVRVHIENSTLPIYPLSVRQQEPLRFGLIFISSFLPSSTNNQREEIIIAGSQYMLEMAIYIADAEFGCHLKRRSWWQLFQNR